MIVMAGHRTIYHRWATMHELMPEKYPHGTGFLMSPEWWRVPPDYIPYALDNDRFSSWSNGKEWDADAFVSMLRRASLLKNKPIFCAVPDVVADPIKTTDWWNDWSCTVESYGFKTAFCVQDGHQPEDVPRSAFATFIGGTSTWKANNAHRFNIREWLHIGRVNGPGKLDWAESIGADSVDGTGWARGQRQLEQLKEFIEGSKQLKISWKGRVSNHETILHNRSME